jgi:hypothetical protein
MGMSLMLASRRRIRLRSSNSPEFVSVAAVPIAGVVVPFVLKAHRDPVVGERSETAS